MLVIPYSFTHPAYQTVIHTE